MTRRDRPCEAERAMTAKAIAAYVLLGAIRSAAHGTRAAGGLRPRWAPPPLSSGGGG